MDKLLYTNDKGTQIVLSLLKAHGIKKVIASPGTTNIALVASMQIDPWFEMYSAVDERGAAYMACGMAAATGEPVVISCTGATASRNYYPGMTEAYYRKLPIIAITGSHGKEYVGNLQPQVIDRSIIAKDACLMSVEIGSISNEHEERNAIVKVNNVLLEARHRGGGPVHIDLLSAIGAGFSTESLPEFPKICRYMPYQKLPDIDSKSKTAIYIGSHSPMDNELTELIDTFCAKYNAVVFCEVISGYNGKFKIATQQLLSQYTHENPNLFEIDTMIHIGEVSGDYYSLQTLKPKSVWRVSEDGVVRDLMGTLTNVFEMREVDFFKYYAAGSTNTNAENVYFSQLNNACKALYSTEIEIPFSNIWVANEIRKSLSDDAIVHFAIINSERSFNLSDYSSLSCEMRCNVGGFGIDGPISTIIGSALALKDKEHFLITGDLAFFYDLNSLGNRHLPSNLHILLINNGKGTEFRNYDHPGNMWGEEADCFIAAGGHFGDQSENLVKSYSSSLGINYLAAHNKKDFNKVLPAFLSSSSEGKGVVLEVFTNSKDESEALLKIRMKSSPMPNSFNSKLKNKIKSLIGK